MVRLSQTEARAWASVHPPEVMRRGSDLGHILLGTILGLAGLLALLESLGILAGGVFRFLWSALLFLAGASLVALLLFHHGVRKVRLAAKATWIDPQQKQHAVMGALVTLAGLVELLRPAGILPPPSWPVLPAVLFIVGALFLAHAQHGTDEASRKAVRYHRVLGATLVIAALLRALEVMFAFPAYLWSLAVLASAVLLLAYREPAGAYEMPHAAHGPGHEA